MKWISFMIVGILMPLSLQSNNLDISELSRDSLNQTITFDLSWENSWRVDSTGAPGNWDAVWLFIKFQECDALINSDWNHALINPVLGSHSFGDLEPVLSDGTGVGIDAVPYNHGVMLRRSSNGLFSGNTPTQVTLSLLNLLPTTAYNIRVIGIEMVFVPEGAYQLGSVPYSNAFASTPVFTNTTPLDITTEASQAVFYHNSWGTNPGTILPATFPKGYSAFHMMKYEVAAGQYASFLNTISPGIQYTRFPGNIGSNRNTLTAGGTATSPFVTNRPTRAQNYLGWDDLTAFLDWAALRPMTEMEYEKACRGSDTSIVDQFPWGTTIAFQLTNITTPEDGSEIAQNQPSNVHSGYPNFTGGDQGYGPVRIGMFALPTSLTRAETGASFYGVLDLSGNIAEACVKVAPVTSTTGTIAFTGAPGDGVLSNVGEANEPGWPTATDAAAIQRGGGFDNNTNYARISDRTQFNWNGIRGRNTGGRGVRN